jgi:hypothetical protein
MSANNQVIIRKINDSLFQGFDIDVDGYNMPENAEYYAKKLPDFEATTLEGAIRAYKKYCVEIAENGFYVEYGLAFEGL